MLPNLACGSAIIETNVIVDVLAKREPFFADSSLVLDRAERGDYIAMVCATTVTTLYMGGAGCRMEIEVSVERV